MNWKTKYYGKLAAQKVLGAVPGLYQIQEAVKTATRRHATRIDEAFVVRRFEAKVDQFQRAGLMAPRVVLEQGSGWHGIDLVLFHLAGSERIHTFDTRPWLRPNLVRSVARAAVNVAPIVARWSGDADGVAARAAALASAAADETHDILELLGAEYTATASMSRAGIADDSVDLFYTDSVVQRFVPSDLAALLGEVRRVLAPNGATHHVVDCKDFHAIDDKRIPELGYLTPGSRRWGLMTSRYLNYQNRLRMPQLVDAFESAGFTVRTLEERRTPENLEFARTQLAGHGLWGHLDPEAVAVSRFELVGECPHTVIPKAQPEPRSLVTGPPTQADRPETAPSAG